MTALSLETRIVWAGVIALAVAMGVGRFAFTPLLPMMLQQDLLTLQEGGWLATVNYIGYFLGAIACLFIRPDAARMVRLGLVLTVVLTFAMAFPASVHTWALWRTASGVASALVLVFGSAWCAQRLAELGRSTWGGAMFAGPGIGIVVTGLPAPAMVAAGWSVFLGWAILGGLAFVMTVLVWRIFVPAEIPKSTLAKTSEKPRVSAPLQQNDKVAVLNGEAWLLTLCYGLAGFGYIITATFLPVIARQTVASGVLVDMFWPILGVGTAVGAFSTVWMHDRLDNRRMLACGYWLQAIGVALIAFWPTATAFFISSILVGLPFTAISVFAVREARRLWQHRAAQLIGLMTALYGLGQIVGPLFATSLVARTGTFSESLMVAAAALALGGGVFWWRSVSEHLPH